MSVTLDWQRTERTGLPEAIFCEAKRTEDLVRILNEAGERPLLLTRLGTAALEALPAPERDRLDYDGLSRTAFWGAVAEPAAARVAIVAAGTGDLPVAAEAARTLAFLGHGSTLFADVGVAGLWRLTSRLDEIAAHDIVIAVAGMEGALFSVLSGLVRQPVFAVPTSVGYGVAQGGRAALSSALASCAPGLSVLNIDNGFGAACAAVRVLALLARTSTDA